MADETFETGDAGGSLTYPVQAGALRKGAHVVIKGFPCKVVDISTSKTGKHGHAKANIVALDIFTGNKYQDVCPTSHNMEAPFVSQNEYQLLDISAENFVTLMTTDGDTREDLKMTPDAELAGRIRETFDGGETVMVTITKAMGHEQIMSFKVTRE